MDFYSKRTYSHFEHNGDMIENRNGKSDVNYDSQIPNKTNNSGIETHLSIVDHMSLDTSPETVIVNDDEILLF